MRILLTNDDGIYAPGLRALRKELQKLGEVLVVAPATEQSAVGHSITLLTPLLVQEILDEDKSLLGWAVEGRPADCVKLALLALLPEPPDVDGTGRAESYVTVTPLQFELTHKELLQELGEWNWEL